jgi:hypothetical protein
MDFNPVPAFGRVGVNDDATQLRRILSCEPAALRFRIGLMGQAPLVLFGRRGLGRSCSHADTPKRPYAYTLPLPDILPRVPKSVEELSIKVRPDLFNCFYHRLSRLFR